MDGASPTQPEQAKTVFKQIFADGWTAFVQRHPRYAAVDEVVQKMRGCVLGRSLADPNPWL